MRAPIPELRFSTTAGRCCARTSDSFPWLKETTPGVGIFGTARQHRRGWRTASIDLCLSRERGRAPSDATDAIPFLLTIMHNTTLRPTVSLEVLIPITDPEGRPFPDSFYVAFEQRIVNLTGGITRRADVEGVWRAPSGEVMREFSRSYGTTVDEGIAARIATDIDRIVRTQFRQIASFIQATPTTATVF